MTYFVDNVYYNIMFVWWCKCCVIVLQKSYIVAFNIILLFKYHLFLSNDKKRLHCLNLKRESTSKFPVFR